MFQKRARGLLDLILAACAITTLFTTTPLGELMSRLGRQVLGVRGRDTELIAFFGPVAQPGRQNWTAPEPTGVVATLAKAYGNTPALLKGFALASAVDPQAAELAMDLTAPGRALLLARGVPETELGTPQGRLRAVSQALSALTQDLGSGDAALTALVVGLDTVRYAVGRARAERVDPTLEALLPHLAPAQRSRAAVVGRALTLATAFELTWPVPRQTRISSRFGRRSDPLSHAQAHHTGVDLSVPEGTPIASTSDGIVKRSGEDGMNGRFLIIDHGHGVTSAYCHNSELLVLRDTKVTRHQTISKSGNTGRSTGPHLHYQVAIDGVPVDPLALLAENERPAIQAER